MRNASSIHNLIVNTKDGRTLNVEWLELFELSLLITIIKITVMIVTVFVITIIIIMIEMFSVLKIYVFKSVHSLIHSK